MKLQPMDKIQIIDRLISAVSEFDSVCGGMKFGTVKKYRDYYHAVDAYIQQGIKKPEAITWVSDDFRVSEDTVYRALREFG